MHLLVEDSFWNILFRCIRVKDVTVIIYMHIVRDKMFLRIYNTLDHDI